MGESTVRAEVFAFPGDPVKALSNHRYGCRLRVGDYRVLFGVLEIIDVISIEEVKKRDEYTY